LGQIEDSVRRPSVFKKTDITRAAKAVLAAGVDIARVEIEPATVKITILTSSSVGDQEITDLDKWIAKDARQT
jgi:hypothetical protein